MSEIIVHIRQFSAIAMLKEELNVGKAEIYESCLVDNKVQCFVNKEQTLFTKI